MTKKCRVEINGKKHEGLIHGFYQFAEPFTSVLRGQESGQIAYPVAVVSIDGDLKTVRIEQVSEVER